MVEAPSEPDKYTSCHSHATWVDIHFNNISARDGDVPSDGQNVLTTSRPAHDLVPEERTRVDERVAGT